MSSANPVTEFLSAIERAANRGVDTAPAALATADRNGRPAVRMVLVRAVDDRGFVFHTNYNSPKAQQLLENPQAELCFHWHALEEQIRIGGSVEKLGEEESEAYFASRPRGSQLGAWVSRQSAVLASRETLEEAYREIERQYEGRTVPRPPFWGGFRIVPDRIEFWFGRPDRLHDRLLYTREGAAWKIERLYP